MAKKVLIICEGVDKEPKIFARVKALGFLPQDVEVVSYGTNIYKLYRCLERESQGYEDGWNSLDLQLMLVERAQTEDGKRILQDQYTDILLIFDFDPQDSYFRNHPEEAFRRFNKLLEFFSESTEHGKLYLSYPMVEALLHVSKHELENADWETFLERRFTKEEVRQKTYKRRSAQEGENEVTAYDRAVLVRLIRWHLKKAFFIASNKDGGELMNGQEIQCLEKEYEKHVQSGEDSVVGEKEMQKLLEREYDVYMNSGAGYVVSTSLFYIAEAYPQCVGLK